MDDTARSHVTRGSVVRKEARQSGARTFLLPGSESRGKISAIHDADRTSGHGKIPSFPPPVTFTTLSRNAYLALLYDTSARIQLPSVKLRRAERIVADYCRRGQGNKTRRAAGRFRDNEREQCLPYFRVASSRCAKRSIRSGYCASFRKLSLRLVTRDDLSVRRAEINQSPETSHTFGGEERV